MEEEALKVESGKEGERADFESGARLSGENPPRAYVVARSVQMYDRIVDLGAFKLWDGGSSMHLMPS